MSSSDKKYIGESTLSGQPEKHLVLKLKDGSVTTNKIADGAVTSNKIDGTVANSDMIDDLQNQIDSLEISGVALSNEFGDDTHIGISQKTLTEFKEDVEEKDTEQDGELLAHAETLDGHTEALSNIYRKSETYNKEELNNMITTPEQEFVSVATYAELPETGSANTIYRVANWDGTQIVANCYTEYAWDGSQYVQLSTKNPGIDNIPTAGSDNLVKSGGVKAELDVLTAEMEDLMGSPQASLDLSSYAKHGGVISSTNYTWAVVSNVNYKHIVIPVSGGEVYVSQYNNSQYPVWAFLKSYTEPTENGGTPDWCDGYTTTIKESTPTSTITIPSDCNYLYFIALSSGADTLPASLVKNATEGRVSEVEEAVQDNTEDITALGNRVTDIEGDLYTPEMDITLDIAAEGVLEARINVAANMVIAIADSGVNKYRVLQPVYLYVGDVISLKMGAFSNSYGVVAKTSSSTIAAGDGVTTVLIADTTSHLDTPYTYTVIDEGYYVIGINITYAGYSASVHRPASNKLTDMQADINSNTTRITALEGSVDGMTNPMINVFGDILPRNFKGKYFASEEDVEIVCVGDSLTGLTQYCVENSGYESLPAGFRYNHWTYQLWNRLCLNKPTCVNINSESISKVGTWESYDNVSSGYYGDWSVTAETYKCADTTASVSFTFDADAYEKCNIVMTVNPDGAETEIVISGGNGKLLASLDRNTWVEANGFAVSQIASISALRERHRRIWLKKVEGVTGNVTITYQRTDSDATKCMYFWGIEMWRGASLFLTNIGRGGRNIELLTLNINDILDRNPDLCILELPLANETSYFSTFPTATLKAKYSEWLTAFATNTNNYADTELMVVLPHGRKQYYNGNNLAYFVSDGTADIYNHQKAKCIFQYIYSQTSTYKEHIAYVDLMEQIINEGIARGLTIEEWMTGNHDGSTMTYDNIHLHTNGSQIWFKYLAPIFQ